jgi:hypothetical protein
VGPAMNARSIAYIIVGLAILLITWANRSLLMSPTELNFIVGHLHAPPALLVVLVAAAIFAIEFGFHAVSRQSWRRERRTLAERIEELQLRADAAEASRIRELRELVERETGAIHEQLERVLTSLAR